ncbi:hypothetical protein [Acidiphilium sp. MT5]
MTMRLLILGGLAFMLVLGVACAKTDQFGQSIVTPKIPPLGMCEKTWITQIEARFGPNDPIVHDGRTTVFESGIYTSNEGSPPAERNEHLYDKVLICLTKIPNNCPKYYSKNGTGNHALSQFYEYTISDENTGQSWTDTPSEHKCNGA